MNRAGGGGMMTTYNAKRERQKETKRRNRGGDFVFVAKRPAGYASLKATKRINSLK